MRPILIDRLISFALDLWSRVTSKPAEPIASQRDIAIGVASGEAARIAGKTAAEITRMSNEGHAKYGVKNPVGVQYRECQKCFAMWGTMGPSLPSDCPNCKLDDTWPGERK